jgi:hypothetical protein
VVYGPDGTIRGKHRKAHLYRPTAEHGRVVAQAPGLDTAREPHLMTSEIDLAGELRRADQECAVLWTDDRPEIY